MSNGDSSLVYASKLGDGYGDFGGPGDYSPENDYRVNPPAPPAGDYVNAFSPDGTHTSLDKNFENTQMANVQKSDPNYSIQNGYALPVSTPSPIPKLLVIGAAGFAVYWFLIRKKV